MSGNSWDHTIRPFTDEELAAWEASEKRNDEKPEDGSFRVGRDWLEKHYPGRSFWVECSHPKCHARPVFHTSYRYVTGRAGRVTTRDQIVCREHGEQFAHKHGLQAALFPADQEAKQPEGVS